jgi:hypothetical protein
MKPAASECRLFGPKCIKTHLRASTGPKNFLGSLSLAMKGKNREGRGGRGRGKEGRGREGSGGEGRKGKGGRGREGRGREEGREGQGTAPPKPNSWVRPC